ncbi:O-antigen ligase family protein [Deinococcus sp. QL22]|uniref:O-antigen ligase family protein n=1 Tax=Deinococcus sp. QL22 TaxID=2939437 RepID=UPI002017094F|nr:O-antigen ligase family protein [Deinococcus sp. QL22]UQN09753.1 O-antigen ligase family protein [Deinococcus sp. QL22]
MLGAAAVGTLAVWNPLLAFLAALLVFAFAAALAVRAQLPRLALTWLGVCLLGYAMMGRGFAYLGVAPLFVGEMILAVCIVATLVSLSGKQLVQSKITYVLVAFLLIGLAATVTQVGTYALDALRDAVLWGYGLFGLAVAALLLHTGLTLNAARTYLRFIPVFLVWTPIATFIFELFPRALPRIPGSQALLIDLKGGDIAVHLAGIATLMMLGLPQLLRPVTARLNAVTSTRQEWLWWMLWLAAALIPLFRVRAGIVAIAAAVLIVLVLRFGARVKARWGKPALLFTLALTALLTFGGRINLGEERNTISAEALLLNLQGITGQTGDGDRDGSRGWRLKWWTDIVNYTANGPYFWTGKGYGINLADDDGYQLEGNTLRSPHNGHLNILARSGVPGVVVWALLQLAFMAALLRAYQLAKRAGQDLWVRLNVWVLAYWAAFMVNASFDVYLEGPQGGIWFWSLFGFGLALLETQRRLRPQWAAQTVQTLPVQSRFI